MAELKAVRGQAGEKMKKKVLFLIVRLSAVPGFLLADKPDDAIHWIYFID